MQDFCPLKIKNTHFPGGFPFYLTRTVRITENLVLLLNDIVVKLIFSTKTLNGTDKYVCAFEKLP